MKLTLDHNVIIDLADRSPRVERLRTTILQTQEHEAFVVDIGASEMRERGIQPDRYDLFESLLREAGIDHLRRLAPLLVWDVTFWDRSVWADAADGDLVAEIEDILFGNSPSRDPLKPEQYPAWLNRVCDVHTMWCHLRSENDVFVTSDLNFHKVSKQPRLIALGAGRIMRPESL